MFAHSFLGWRGLLLQWTSSGHCLHYDKHGFGLSKAGRPWKCWEILFEVTPTHPFFGAAFLEKLLTETTSSASCYWWCKKKNRLFSKIIYFCYRSLEIKTNLLGHRTADVALSYINLAQFENFRKNREKGLSYTRTAVDIYKVSNLMYSGEVSFKR